MAQNKKINSNIINKTEYLYKGAAYRSVAFGTWSVGDASRNFEEKKRFSHSSTRAERKKEINLINNCSSQKIFSLKTEEKKNEVKTELTEQIRKSREEINDKNYQTTFINKNKNIFEKMNKLNKNSDFYSSTEYVKYNNNLIFGNSISSLKNVNLMTKSFPPYSLETFNLFKNNNYFPSSNQNFNYKIYKNNSMQRPRTKSLDNGICFSLGNFHRKDKIREINKSSTTSINTIHAISEKGREYLKKDSKFSSTSLNIFNYSRLEQAKQLFKNFYNSTTLKLKKKKIKNIQQKQELNISMYGSAVGPFFEFRRPCKEELPLLPYNIYYKVESSSECSNHSNSIIRKNNENFRLITADHTNKQIENYNKSTFPLIEEKDNSDRLEPFSNLIKNLDNNSPSTSSFCSFTSPSAFSLSSENNNKLRLPKGQLSNISNNELLTKPKKQTINPFLLMAESPDSAFSDSIEDNNFINKNNNFTNWNELFNYLRKEIVEMNVKDSQILHNLEDIQNELEDVLNLCRIS